MQDFLARGLQLRETGEVRSPRELATLVFDWPWAPYQWEILSRLMEEGWTRLLILAPPRHRKTSILAFYCAWTLGVNPATRIMVASHSRDFAAIILDQVESIMRMPAYRRQFGTLYPGPRDRVRWTSYEKFIPGRPVAIKDPSLLAISPESGTPGYGAELIIVDDLVTPANSFTPGARNRLEMWFFSSLLHRLEPTGKIVVSGARWFTDDLYGKLIQQGWPALVYRASPEAPLWPEHWPAEALREQLERDPIFFTAQYLQEPRDLARSSLDPNWFRYYFQRPEPLAVFCGLDQASTGTGSRFAYVVVGRDPDGIIYVLETYSAHHRAAEMAGLIDSIYERWQPGLFAWESSGTQGGELELLLPQLRNPVNLVPVPSVASKELRTLSVAGLVRSGMVLLPGVVSPSGAIVPADSVRNLYEAWRLFPAGDQDLLDAFEKAVSVARRGPPPATAAATPVQRLVPAHRFDHKSFSRVFHEEVLSDEELEYSQHLPGVRSYY